MIPLLLSMNTSALVVLLLSLVSSVTCRGPQRPDPAFCLEDGVVDQAADEGVEPLRCDRKLGFTVRLDRHEVGDGGGGVNRAGVKERVGEAAVVELGDEAGVGLGAQRAVDLGPDSDAEACE